MYRYDPNPPSGALRRAGCIAAAFLFSVFPEHPGGAADGSPSPGLFIRGDASGDGQVDVTDPISILRFLFDGGCELSCEDAADADDTGSLDVADPIRLLEHLFLGGSAPGDPFPAPGLDPTPDGLECRGRSFLDERIHMDRTSRDARDLEEAQGRALGMEDVASGDPLRVSPAIFEKLLQGVPGQTLDSVLGDAAEPFLAGFFQNRVPASGPEPEGPARILAPWGAGGCYRVDPSLLEAGEGAAGPGKFLRGDVTGNGRVGPEDGKALAACLEGAGPCPSSCWDAADADDDGRVTPADIEMILTASFREAPLPPPWPACGDDPSPDILPGCSDPCGDGRFGPTIAVEPATVCGPGAHEVQVLRIDPDGTRSFLVAIITLCEPGSQDCPEVPQRTPPGGQPPDAAPPICRWIVAVDREPEDLESEFRQNLYTSSGKLSESRREPPILSAGALETWRADRGPGPDHYIFASRGGANCLTPPTEISLPRGGRLQVRANVLCIAGDGSGQLVPCYGTAEVEGFYSSRVDVETEEGSGCLKSCRVEGLSQDEALLTANDKALFAKGVSVQTGNITSFSPSFSFNVGTGPLIPGSAGSLSVSFGYSANKIDRTGRSSDVLEAFGNTSTELPLTISLSARGRIEVHGRRRVYAKARCGMRAYGIWFVAQAQCPVAGPLFFSEILGEEEKAEELRRLSEQFRVTRLGS